jgi:hypothetical protein
MLAADQGHRVLQDSVGEDSSFENGNDLVMPLKSSPSPAVPWASC